MANSMERFTHEQFGLLREQILAAYSGNGGKDEIRALFNTIIGEDLAPLGLNLMLQMKMEGHAPWCPSSMMSLFCTGFIHGWKAREMQLEVDQLEKSFKAEG